jgi:hypothetical protein
MARKGKDTEKRRTYMSLNTCKEIRSRETKIKEIEGQKN